MEKPRPTIDELIRRVEALERGLESTMNAFLADLAALRSDMKRVASETAGRAPLRKDSAPSNPRGAAAPPVGTVRRRVHFRAADAPGQEEPAQ